MNTNVKTRTKLLIIRLWIGITLLLAIFNVSLMAQGKPSNSIEELDTIIPFSQSMSNYIMPLDKSFITTGLLADKAYPNVTLDSFNGETDSIISFRQWKQAHRQLYLAAVSENDTVFSPEHLKRIAKGMKDRGIVPVALMNLKYNAFKPYAIDSNLIVFSDGKFYDVVGRTESPYYEKRLFAATAYQDRIYNGRVSFRFSNDLFLTNSSESVEGLDIDFGDGRGFQNYSLSGLLNNNITVYYRQTGSIIITIRMTLSDQTVLQTRTRITLAPTPDREPDEILDINGLEFNGVSGKGKAYIIYGCGNLGQLRKPIIVSDGFDPWNERTFNGLYELLNKEQFVEKAIAEGYDFVILDYVDGADFIQRNALVMVSLIETVNSRLKANGSFSKLTIVGPSMGGLITRYALNYMEQHPKEFDHNTGLYISFDSPHLGANIPLGDQHWIDFFATNTGKEVAIESRDMLNTVAAQQMLVYHFAATQDNTANPHQERILFLIDPYITYWPSRCRKIAIANGSGEGCMLFDACTQMIKYNYPSLVNFAKGNTWAVPNKSDGKKMIFEGKYPDRFIFCGTVPIHSIKCNIKVKGTQPYDGAPGGTNDVNALIANAETDGHGDITTDYPNVCFIPVISSLALNTNDVNCNVHGIPGYPFPSSDYTPFDAIYAPIDNQEHVEVTEENINWIMSEIGAFDLYLQNQTVNKATDFESRNSITTGRNVVSHIPEGDFVVQNGSGKVLLRSEGTIRLKDGTQLKPWGTGSVHTSASQFLCPSLFALPRNRSGNDTDDGAEEIVETNFAEFHESNLSHPDKLPRNHPNPCSDQTTIEYELEKNAKVEIDVYNLMGIKMMTVKDHQNTGAGRYFTTINTSSLPCGIYIGVVRANGVPNGVLKIQVVK